ncbi:MAG: LPS export ABC transporter periplasmic protein LptC [Thermostichales cyanobacterium SZTDM-1c_bins_54]
MQPTASSSLPKLLWGSLLALGLVGCGIEEPPIPVETSAATVDPLSYENITLTQSARDGRLQWKITATLAQYTPERTVAALTSVSGEFYDSQGDPIRVTAAAGQVLVEERRISLVGSIQAEYPRQGLLLQAQEVQWIPDESRLVASDSVTIQFRDPDNPQRQGEIQGSQLQWNTQDQVLTLTDQPVRLVAREPDLQLTAAQLQWILPSQTIQALGGVELVGQPQGIPEPVQLRGATLTLTPKQAMVSGDGYVRSQGRGELWAQVLRWPLGESLIYASGDVRYQWPGQGLSLRGREGVINWQSQTARLSGGTTILQRL